MRKEEIKLIPLEDDMPVYVENSKNTTLKKNSQN